MLNDDELLRSLRAAIPRVDSSGPSHDLWPRVVGRTHRRPRWTLADWSAAAVILMSLLLAPKWFWFIAYHL